MTKAIRGLFVALGGAGIALMAVTIATINSMELPRQAIANRIASLTEECVLAEVTAHPSLVGVAPEDLRRIRGYCAAQSIWRK